MCSADPARKLPTTARGGTGKHKRLMAATSPEETANNIQNGTQGVANDHVRLGTLGLAQKQYSPLIEACL